MTLASEIKVLMSARVGAFASGHVPQNVGMTLVLPERAGILRNIAARVDNEHIATLTPEEMDFAMTLEGRQLLECL